MLGFLDVGLRGALRPAETRESSTGHGVLDWWSLSLFGAGAFGVMVLGLGVYCGL